MNQTAVIIGASSGLGRSLAEHLASLGNDLILSARNKRDLDTLANHLIILYQVNIEVIHIDLESMSSHEIEQYLLKCFSFSPRINQIYITAGVINENDSGEFSSQYLKKIIQINCVSLSMLISAFAERLKDLNSNITVISSIAAIRSRSVNISYSTSKIALEYFIKGLQHHYANKPLNLQIYRAGYMNTSMSSGKKLLFPISNTENFAKKIFKEKNKKFRLRYYPAFWFPIALIVLSLPWFLYKKLKF